MIELHPGEKIISEVRRHWYILFAESLFILFLALVPLIVFESLSASPLFTQELLPLFIFLSAAWLLLVWIMFCIIWTNYYLDVWIITNQRVIDIEQHHLFSREVSEFKLEKIQDITVEVHGFIATFLHFGDLHVQTAGQLRRFLIRHVPYPDHVKEIIFKQYNELIGKGSPSAD